MDLSFVAIQALNGLASASSLFITACGLTLVFGVTRIVNFAHGSLYMVGAFTAATLVPWLLDMWFGPASFWAGILISAIIVGLIGVIIEVLLLRRIYGAPELFQLLATFGVVLVVQDLVIQVFGPQDILGPRAPGLRAPVEILGRLFPSYELVLIAAGPVVLGLVWLLLRKTRFGILIRAATQDRDMVAALGVNQAMLFTGTLFLGAFLAGLGGALQIPRVAANTGMDLSIIAECFVVTVVGGMGSVPGAFLAALIIGQLQAFGILIFPKSTLVVVFLLMALVLAVQALRLVRTARDHRRHPCGGHRQPQADAARPASRDDRHCPPGGACRCWRDAYLLKVVDRDPGLCAVRVQSPAADRRRRAGEFRPCGVFRPRRLWIGAHDPLARRAHGGGAAGWARSRRSRRGPHRRLRGAPVGHLSRHDDARGSADPLRGRIPVGAR